MKPALPAGRATSPSRSPRVANPNPATYTVPAGFTHQDVHNALERVRMDTTGTLVGACLPAEEYSTASRFPVYGKAVKVVGPFRQQPDGLPGPGAGNRTGRLTDRQRPPVYSSRSGEPWPRPESTSGVAVSVSQRATAAGEAEGFSSL